MGIKIVCSDMHFGDSDCSLYSNNVSKGLWKFWTELGEVEELILAGDILEANLSSLTKAIQGGRDSTGKDRIGLKTWLQRMVETPNLSIKRIVYLPGNHDYVIFDFLATEKAFIEPLSNGKEILKNLPIMRDTFSNAFIRGVAPVSLFNKFVVFYPDYKVNVGDKTILITHGHYLDHKQALFATLKKRLKKNPGHESKAVRDYFIAVAQYQALARAAAYMKRSREKVEDYYKSPDSIFSKIQSAFKLIGLIRGDSIDSDLLEAIDLYVKYFHEPPPEIPDVFVFGHTHVPGSSTLKIRDRDVAVFNTGSFLMKNRIAGSFLVINDGRSSDHMCSLYQIDKNGQPKEMNQ